MLLLPAAPAAAVDRIELEDGVYVQSGPVFAGEAVAWAEYPLRVAVRDAAGVRELPMFSPNAAYATEIDASAEIVAAHRHLGNNREGSWTDLAYGPLSGSFGRHRSCDALYPRGLRVTGSYVVQSCEEGTVVTDPATGAAGQTTYEQRGVVGGRFIAQIRADEIVVADRFTGQEQFRVRAPGAHRMDLAEDGTLAFSDPAGVGWASPSDPAVHRLTLPGERPVLAGGAVAVAEPVEPSARTSASTVHVRTLTDEPLGSVAGIPEDRWDFDGRRLTYADRPCWNTTVVVLDPLRETKPSLGTRCGRPRLVERVARITRDRWLTATLVCPRGSTAGCGGVFEAYPPRPPDACCIASQEYAADAGETKRVRVRMHPAGARQLRRLRPPRIAFRLSGGSPLRRLLPLRLPRQFSGPQH
jgi:hypothetical protein